MDAVGAVLEGAGLAKSAVNDLESTSLLQPDNANVRFQLIGYYYAHYYCCVQNRAQRQTHMIWVIENSLFTEKLWSFFDVDVVDVQMFSAVADALKIKMDSEPEDVDLISATANFLRGHAPQESLKLFESCVKKDPTEKRYQEHLANLRKHLKLYVDKKRRSRSQKFEKVFGNDPCDGQIILGDY